MKTKGIKQIENRMDNLESNSMRYKILDSAKSFKSSWINLGQALYTVWKDKLYKEWGFVKFDAYTKKEIGIRKETALKLLKSYYFLEKDESGYLDRDGKEEKSVASIPSYESVNLLRLANNKKGLDRTDYSNLKKGVLENGKDAREVKKDLAAIIKQTEELEPKEAWQKKRTILMKRFMSLLKSLKREAQTTKMFSAQITKDLDKLISRLEAEM
ncbi:MAG: hypothetical protein HQ575_07255 [Candidatus Omnitrophica bacterium]|nr:hypothetical protein [Candidatus Omnitrophota bacterium]